MISIWLAVFLHLFTCLTPYQATKFQGLAAQTEKWDCGPAAALSILSLAGQAGRPWAAHQGASLVELYRYLQSHQLKVEAYELSWQEIEHFLHHFPFRPLLAHCNSDGGHYLLLLGLIGDRLVVADPSEGVRAICSQEFTGAFSGRILHFPDLPALPGVKILLRKAERRLALLEQAVK